MKIKFKPVGVTFYAKNVEKTEIDDVVSFEHRPVFVGSGESKKEYPNAVAVLNSDGEQIGSLAESDHPESPQQTVLRMLKDGNVTARISEVVIPEEDDDFKRTYEIELEVPEVSDITLASMNEPGVIVAFDPVTHAYTKNGKPWLNATKWLEEYFEKFDPIAMADQCATAWKVSPKQITDMWKSNAEVSASFGSVVHSALEHHERYKKVGEQILFNSRKTQNPAIPKHPFLAGVIKEFQEICQDGENIVIPEAMLTCEKKGLCGTADRVVITGEKKCRIGDYKINVDVLKKNEKPKPPFDHLPPTKLTKFQLQLSFYAKLLTLSGWEVEGLDVYVYDGKWKHYELEVIDLNL